MPPTTYHLRPGSHASLLFHFFMSIIIFLSSMVVNPPEGGAWIAMPATDMLLIFGGIIWNVVVSFKESWAGDDQAWATCHLVGPLAALQIFTIVLTSANLIIWVIAWQSHLLHDLTPYRKTGLGISIFFNILLDGVFTAQLFWMGRLWIEINRLPADARHPPQMDLTDLDDIRHLVAIRRYSRGLDAMRRVVPQPLGSISSAAVNETTPGRPSISISKDKISGPFPSGYSKKEETPERQDHSGAAEALTASAVGVDVALSAPTRGRSREMSAGARRRHQAGLGEVTPSGRPNRRPGTLTKNEAMEMVDFNTLPRRKESLNPFGSSAIPSRDVKGKGKERATAREAVGRESDANDLDEIAVVRQQQLEAYHQFSTDQHIDPSSSSSMAVPTDDELEAVLYAYQDQRYPDPTDERFEIGSESDELASMPTMPSSSGDRVRRGIHKEV